MNRAERATTRGAGLGVAGVAGCKVDLAQLREYGGAVAAATDEWLATLAPEDLDRMIDLSAFGFGERSLAWVLGGAVIGHTQAHWGEISALRGLHGAKGFPV